MLTDPHEPGKRTERVAKKPDDEFFFEALNNALADVALPLQTGDFSELPLIYVVGAPRSGTTLLHQLLSRYLQVGYINNMMARFWMRPAVGIRLSQALLDADRRDQLALRSLHGTTEGVEGPHEFGYFWRHWLKLDESPTHHLDASGVQRVDSNGLQQVLEQEILGNFGCPVVFKNVICGFQAELLTRIHPATLFVHIVRNTGDTAASILSSRMERYGSYATWWSLKPSKWPFTDTSTPVEEVLCQVLECRREFREELVRDGVKSIELSYEELCTDTITVLERLRQAINRLGGCLPELVHPIAPLSPSTSWKLPVELQEELALKLSKYES